MKVLNKNVILKEAKVNETVSGIIINNTLENIGEVVYFDETLTNIQKGNLVAYNPEKIHHLNYKGNKYLICNINDIYCILE